MKPAKLLNYNSIIFHFKKKNNLHKKYYFFNLFFVSTFLTPFLSVGLFNIFIDPYGVFQTPLINGFNRAKPEKFTHDMLFKAVETMRNQPTIIFLGSSRVQWGLNPNNPILLSQGKVYNLGLQAANMYEVQRYFEHMLFNQPQLQQVILGIDFLMFSEKIKNTPAFQESILEKQYLPIPELLKLIFSLDAFKSSKETLITNLTNPDYVTVGSGRIKVEKEIYAQGIMRLHEGVSIPGSQENFVRGLARSLRYSPKHKISQARLENLRTLVNICQEKGIDIKVFISPSHATDMEVIYALGLWSEFEQWKREVVKIVPIWDFSGYNSITTEPIKNSMRYYLDSSHYRKEVGDLVLNRIFSNQEEKSPNNFGTLVTTKNIEEHLNSIRIDREVWINNNPEEVKLLQSLQK